MKLLSDPVFKDALYALKESLDAKGKILVLIDLNNTIFFRAGQGHKWPKRRANFKLKHRLHWLRPGWMNFVRRIHNHPRCQLGIYTSITSRNAVPILGKILPEELLESTTLFD